MPEGHDQHRHNDRRTYTRGSTTGELGEPGWEAGHHTAGDPNETW